jgi:hypothetical protein
MMCPASLGTVPTTAELELIEAARLGSLANYVSSNPDENDPSLGSTWGPERTIRGEILCALLLKENPLSKTGAANNHIGSRKPQFVLAVLESQQESVECHRRYSVEVSRYAYISKLSERKRDCS